MLEKEMGRLYSDGEDFYNKMFVYLLNTVFTTYTFMLFARVFGSWVPPFSRSRYMRFVAYYTDPYLNVFRKIIPPLGMLDLSPMVAFIALQAIQWVLFSVIR